MATRVLNGTTSIALGAIATDGTPPSTFVAIGNTVQDTTIFKQAADANTDFFIEESQSPIFTAVKKGTITLVFSCYDIEVSNLILFFGGTATGTAPAQIWAAPNVIATQNLGVQVTALSGQVLTINNGLVSATFNLNFGRTKIGQIDFIVTVLQPIKAGVPRFTMGADQ